MPPSGQKKYHPESGPTGRKNKIAHQNKVLGQGTEYMTLSYASPQPLLHLAQYFRLGSAMTPQMPSIAI